MRSATRHLIIAGLLLLGSCGRGTDPGASGTSAFYGTSKSLWPTSGAVAWAPLRSGSVAVPSILAGGTVHAITAAGTSSRTAAWTFGGLAQGYYKVEALYPAAVGNSRCVAVQFQTYMEGSWGASGWTPTSWKTFKTRVNQTTGDANSAAPTVAGWTPKLFNLTRPFPGATNNRTYLFVKNDRLNKPNSGRLTLRVNDVPLAGCPSARMVADTVRLTLIQAVTTAPTTAVNQGI
jgi:hypothetical protein